MKKITAIIVDDESASRNILSNLLEITQPEIEILEQYQNLPDAVIGIRTKKPDVVFLDVEMPQFSGYEIVNFFDEINFQIVFVTAYDKYAIKAFEVNAVDYLLKPIERIRLDQALDKVKQNFTHKRDLVDYKKILHKVMNEESPIIELSDARNNFRIKTTEIIAIEAQGAYSKVHLKNEDEIILSKNIGALEKELSRDENFFRSHKSWLINTREITSIQKSSETISLSNDLVCRLSRFKKSNLIQRLDTAIN